MLGFWVGAGLALLGIFVGNLVLVAFGAALLAVSLATGRESRQVIVQPAGRKGRYRVLPVQPVEEEWPLEMMMGGPLPDILKQLPLAFAPAKQDAVLAREMMGILPGGIEAGQEKAKYYRGMDPFRELLLKQRGEFSKELEGMKKRGEKELREMKEEGESGEDIEKAKEAWEKRIDMAKDEMVSSAWGKSGTKIMWRRDALPFPNYGFTNPLEKIFIGFPFNLGSAVFRRAYGKEQLAPGKETIAFKQLKKILFEEEIKLKGPKEED